MRFNCKCWRSLKMWLVILKVSSNHNFIPRVLMLSKSWSTERIITKLEKFAAYVILHAEFIPFTASFKQGNCCPSCVDFTISCETAWLWGNCWDDQVICLLFSLNFFKPCFVILHKFKLKLWSLKHGPVSFLVFKAV